MSYEKSKEQLPSLPNPWYGIPEARNVRVTWRYDSTSLGYEIWAVCEHCLGLVFRIKLPYERVLVYWNPIENIKDAWPILVDHQKRHDERNQ